MWRTRKKCRATGPMNTYILLMSANYAGRVETRQSENFNGRILSRFMFERLTSCRCAAARSAVRHERRVSYRTSAPLPVPYLKHGLVSYFSGCHPLDTFGQ